MKRSKATLSQRRLRIIRGLRSEITELKGEVLGLKYDRMSLVSKLAHLRRARSQRVDLAKEKLRCKLLVNKQLALAQRITVDQLNVIQGLEKRLRDSRK